MKDPNTSQDSRSREGDSKPNEVKTPELSNGFGGGQPSVRRNHHSFGRLVAGLAGIGFGILEIVGSSFVQLCGLQLMVVPLFESHVRIRELIVEGMYVATSSYLIVASAGHFPWARTVPAQYAQIHRRSVISISESGQDRPVQMTECTDALLHRYPHRCLTSAEQKRCLASIFGQRPDETRLGELWLRL